MKRLGWEGLDPPEPTPRSTTAGGEGGNPAMFRSRFKPELITESVVPCATN